ncbi:MAG: 23S rRNA (adenine(2503)-C(2))-methyltransferase RlmN [Acholeplasmataceae bacterium]|nr:23S rRNA (adenine(2503)-C(2))-methyltransferase RlmN [Acholeplasmataceae bacterium]
MINIYSLTRQELEQYLLLMGEKPFRATQIFEWLYKKNVKSFDEMTNIKKESIEKLKENFKISDLEIENEQISSDGTRKYLFRLKDGNFIETVLMNHEYGLSVCVSTQVGCNMGCAFCASGLNKKVRNLETDEIVLQVSMIDEIMKKMDKRVSHVVVMGIGEPFDNYNNVIKFLRIINDPKGLEIGSRHITVSTCGIVPKIIEYSDFDLQVNLAVSLHFADNEKRSKYMKINQVYDLSALMDSLKYYFSKTNRRITFEYILINDVNDSIDDAKKLVKLIKGMNCYVNLIPMNSTVNEFSRSTEEKSKKFFEVLNSNHINVTLRKEQGHDIDAACGQLRIKKMQGKI